MCRLMKPKIGTAKNRVKALPNPTSVERNDKNITENQGKMSSNSRKITGKIREIYLEIAMATLCGESRPGALYCAP